MTEKKKDTSGEEVQWYGRGGWITSFWPLLGTSFFSGSVSLARATPLFLAVTVTPLFLAVTVTPLFLAVTVFLSCCSNHILDINTERDG